LASAANSARLGTSTPRISALTALWVGEHGRRGGEDLLGRVGLLDLGQCVDDLGGYVVLQFVGSQGGQTSARCVSGPGTPAVSASAGKAEDGTSPYGVLRWEGAVAGGGCLRLHRGDGRDGRGEELVRLGPERRVDAARGVVEG